MSDELKACPFCGKSDIHIEQKGTFFWCECYDCGASSREHHTLPGVNILQSEGFARGYWNTRPIEDALRARIAELEEDNKKAFDLVRKLRMYCIWANWDNPDTEDEFNEFDVEVCKWLSKFMEREE